MEKITRMKTMIVTKDEKDGLCYNEKKGTMKSILT